jgi:methylated-DNA-[protein]-cysteine S-methyltransferase
MEAQVIETPVGGLRLEIEGGAITVLSFTDERPGPALDDPLAGAVVVQLGEYFAGARREFDLPLAPRGTEFQRAVWAELALIPFGHTISYGELARRLGNPAAVRAVGRANGSNPIPIVLPCHRVIGADGSLTGYGGGLDRKQALLRLEGALPGAQMTLL